MPITGTSGNDNVTGTNGNDTFKLHQGGEDVASGKAGNDTFLMKGALSEGDALNGGAGNDTVVLGGFYFGLDFNATTITGVETLRFEQPYDYSVTLHDGNVGAGDVLTVDASALFGGHALEFDASAETDGRLSFIGSGFNDDLTGGAGRDKFDLVLGGNEDAFGRGGKDTFLLGNELTANDEIDGGGGNDTVKIDGMGLQDGIFFNATTMTGIDKIVATADEYFALSSHEATVAAGATLEIDGRAVGTQTFFWGGQAETDGSFLMRGGGFGGILIGGALADDIRMSAHSSTYGVFGGGGADEIACNTGGESISFNTASESTSTTHDVVKNFNADEDVFDTSITVSEVSTDSGEVNQATFDADLASEANDWTGAKVLTVTGGDLVGNVYLLIDINGSVSYEAGVDLVIDITGFTGTIDTTDFT